VSEQTQGPVMLAVTNILRPPPARIGKISENFVLPRTIELRKLIAVAVGVLAGMFLWFMPIGLFFSYGLTSLFTMMGVGGFGGYFVVTWSPLRGESLGTWVGLSAGSTRPGKVRIEGERVRAYLGVAPLGFVAAGAVRIRPGAVQVPAGSVDERGVPLSQDEILRLLSDDAHRQLGFPAR
jgi:hypothetical protein